MYVEVAVNLPPVRGTFDYHLPPRLRTKVSIGHLVTAPFGHREVQGLVIATPSKPAVPQTRPIISLLDPEPVVTPPQLELARWLSTETHTPLIDCLTLMLPPGLSQQADSLYHLEIEDAQVSGPLQQRLLDMLRKRGDLRGRQISRAMPRRRWRSAMESLIRRGIVSRTPVLDPPRVRPRKIRVVSLAVPPETLHPAELALGREGSQASTRRQKTLEALLHAEGSLPVRQIYESTGATWADLRWLHEHRLIALSESEIWRDPLEEIDFVPSTPPELTQDQARLWEAIRPDLGTPGRNPTMPFLLQGVTGSGKTEIYLRAVEATLKSGMAAIVLVPEIALTPQTLRRFLARFPGRVGVYHSQLSDGERYDTWRRCRAGELQVIVGPRSALFTPFPRIGLIVLDESHDESYKEQLRAPRYHAREAAQAYARILNAVCILGSATPDVVTRFRADQGQLQRLTLPQRILGHRDRLQRQARRLGLRPEYRPIGGDAQAIDLPPVRVVDMRMELKSGNTSMFSRPLQEALRETLDARQQAILFLNRRGAATYVFCRDCGWVARCSHCDTPLTFHADDKRLRCHHCNHSREPFHRCPECGSLRVRHFGAGTQRVQAEVERLFPGARTLRWDRDTTRGKGSHASILARFAAHEADVLIGTQMLAKGLDLPLVTLVGVISADIGLNLPDYRAPERTFQVLTQVAGRAGRGLLGGRVILQTYQPDHYVIRAASNHDYEDFYRHELRYRLDLDYPPYTRLVSLTYRHPSRETAAAEAERMARVLRHRLAERASRGILIGPAPCFFERIRGHYRWQIILRSKEPLDEFLENLPEGWAVDVDPVSLL